MSEPLGVFGGTFDPVHQGHMRMVAAARRQYRLDSVRFVVSARPPHRQPPLASAAQRLAMLRAALSADRLGEPDDQELHRPGPSYTVFTLRALRAQHPRRHLVLLIGADAYLGLTRWYRWEEVSSLAHLLVFPRRPAGVALDLPGGDAELLRRCVAGTAQVCDTPPLDVSASEIRTHIAAGKGRHPQLDQAVWDYITRHGLYEAHSKLRGEYAT